MGVGQMFFTRPYPPTGGGTSVYDNFNRANSDTLGGNWTYFG